MQALPPAGLLQLCGYPLGWEPARHPSYAPLHFLMSSAP